MPVSNSHYIALQDLLIRTISDLEGSTSEAERDEVMEFVNVGEYGVALEILVAILDESQVSVPLGTFKIMKEATEKMEFPPSIFDCLKRLDRGRSQSNAVAL